MSRLAALVARVALRYMRAAYRGDGFTVAGAITSIETIASGRGVRVRGALNAAFGKAK